jgi:hypothetical protein
MDRPARCRSLPPALITPSSSRISRRRTSLSELPVGVEQNEEAAGYGSDDQSIYSSAQNVTAEIQTSVDDIVDNSEITQYV